MIKVFIDHHLSIHSFIAVRSEITAHQRMCRLANQVGGVMDTGNYRNRVPNPLAEKLGIPKLNFQILRRTMAARAQKVGSVKDIQAHLRHAKADTTANEYMQELPESVKQMVGSVYAMLSMQAEPCKGSQLCYQTPPNRSAEML